MKHVLLALILLCSTLPSKAQDTPFWYAEPAKDWKAAIPLGNGRIGAMVFGGVEEEQILINEHSIWCGPPLPQNNPEGPSLIKRMRQLVFDGRYAEAEALCAKEMFRDTKGDDRSYQPFGFLRLRNAHGANAQDYRRSLDCAKALATVSYRADGVTFKREAFVSNPDQVLVIWLTADKPGSISFTATMDRPWGAQVRTEGNNRLRMDGRASAQGDRHLGTSFVGMADFKAIGGKVEANEGSITVTGADSVTVLVAVETDYNLKDPSTPLKRSMQEACLENLATAAYKPLPEVRGAHEMDFSELYNRSTLVVGDGVDERVDIALNQRIADAAKGSDDPALLLAYYRYCRYLLISGSREGGLPLNLQGIWNPLMKAPWRSNFHININVEEGYWFAEPGNLPECHEPFFTLTERLADNGRETARVMLGTRRGFAAGHRTDASFYTCLIGPAPKWGMYVVGGAWCAQHMMEHYRFTQDREFLEKRAFPVIRGAALFFVDWLVEHPKTGKLVSGPTASAENMFKTPDGKKASLSMGTSQDQEMIWSTFRDYLEAARILGIRGPETEEVQQAMERLAMPGIGTDGRLLEWAEPFEEPEPGHRHLSHLWGMMPGNRISLEKTPELAKAVRKSLDYRLSHRYDAQGWSLGWATCMMTRLGEGDRALGLIKSRYFQKAYPNMFVDAHGQVQVADMMGIPLAMIEMLVQSQTGKIELLPALPSAWPDGKVTGICARGGFVIDLEWKQGRVAAASVLSRSGGPCHVGYDGKHMVIQTEPGERYDVRF